MTMEVSETERFLDQDGQPIEELTLEGSRFDAVAVKRLDEGIEVRAIDEEHEYVVEFETRLTETLFKGVQHPDNGPQRRDIDDDIQDAIHTVGYTLVNG